MTRYTNFARKRTYVQAGFDNEPQAQPDTTDPQSANTSGETGQEREAKKRKQARSRKAKLPDACATAAGGNQNEGDVAAGGKGEVASARPWKKGKFGDKGRMSNKFDKRYPQRESSTLRVRIH